jgi:hypothetical protein
MRQTGAERPREPRRSEMSTDYEANEAAVRRFQDATNTGDVELISTTIDELVKPDAPIRTHCRSKRPARKR